MEDDKKIDDIEDIDDEEEESGSFKQWLQDNLRIIISILIVVAIAGGIYSYSNRTEAPTKEEPKESILDDTTKEDILKKDEKTSTEKPAEKSSASQVVSSQETGSSFIETAVKGEGTTHLARRALANYLEKNSDSTLTAEHKIYIEDYLRKNVPKKRVKIGTSVEFSKDLIQDAISKSKNLNEKQLNNLHKYAVRVPSLS